jgi:16S rRNA (cytidine1402-2'-O)-methyltransferase
MGTAEALVCIPNHLWFNESMGTLYLVATPIGNLEDMSPRAVRTLGAVRLIAAEDTRLTQKLLNRFGLHTPLTSYFEHNKLAKLEPVLAALAQGDVALVSDAGTPAINDPGVELVRTALAAGHAVCPVPGPSAPLAALAASGLPTDAFLYLGYLPRKAGERVAFLQRVEDLPFTLIFLEAPHRLLESLADLLATLGDRPVAVARELTKLHEQIWRGSLVAAGDYFTRHSPRGEFTLVVGGCIHGDAPRWAEDRLLAELKAGLAHGEAPSALAKRAARASGWERKHVYHLLMGMTKNESG